MVGFLAMYLTFQIARSVLSYHMYRNLNNEKVKALCISSISIETVCFIIDMVVVVLFLKYFIAQNKKANQDYRTRQKSLWDKWNFCMVITLIAGVSVLRSLYRTISTTAFDIWFAKNKPEVYYFELTHEYNYQFGWLTDL